MYKVTLFPGDARLLIECHGFWDVPTARAFRDEMAVALAAGARLARPLRMLADLSDHAIQDSRVSDVNAEVAALIERAPIDRYALVIHSALVRMQARRLLSGVTFQVHARIDEAAAWLEWPLADLERVLERREVRAAAE